MIPTVDQVNLVVVLINVPLNCIGESCTDDSHCGSGEYCCGSNRIMCLNVALENLVP